MVNEKLGALLDGTAWQPEYVLTQWEIDLIASVQRVTDETVLKVANNIACEICLSICVASRLRAPSVVLMGTYYAIEI